MISRSYALRFALELGVYVALVSLAVALSTLLNVSGWPALLIGAAAGVAVYLLGEHVILPRIEWPSGSSGRLDLVDVVAPLETADVDDVANGGAGIAFVALAGVVSLGAAGTEHVGAIGAVGFVAIVLLLVSLRLHAEGSQ